MCSWQLLLLMALAKCCAPMCEMLFSVRFNVRSWQLLLLMASAKCCAPMSEMLFSERFNVCSWQLLLLMASAKCCAASSVNWFLVRFNQLSWDSLHFNNLQISKQPNRPMLLYLKSKCEICWTLLHLLKRAINSCEVTINKIYPIKFHMLKFSLCFLLHCAIFV